MSARFAIYKENGVLDSAFPVFEGGLTGIGRDTSNFVQLEDSRVSKRHAVLKREGNAWFIEDLKSRNGVFVNGMRVHVSELKHGDKLQIGPYVMVFEPEVHDKGWVPDHVINPTSVAGQQTMQGFVRGISEPPRPTDQK